MAGRLAFGIYGVGIGAMATSQSSKIARLAEELGYESLWTGEHMVLPSPQVPPSHRPPDHHFLDPIAALSFLAAHTSTIRLATGVLLLPQRHPLQLAKELASIDVLSEGRLIVGVGVGYMLPELAALGVDPTRRGARADECLAAMRVLWKEKLPVFDGEFFRFSGIDAYPRPTNPDGPPVVVGGNNAAGLSRAARSGDGWYGYRLGPVAAAEAVATLHSLFRDRRRSWERFDVTVTPDRDLDDRAVAAYRAAGVDRLVVVAEGPDLASVDDIVRRNAPGNWCHAS